MRSRSLSVLCLAAVSLALVAPSTVKYDQGVASGEVTDDGAVLWTRADRTATLKVEVFDNPKLKPPKAFQQTVRATSASDLTAKATATGLAPETQYWYRWRLGNKKSEVGTFRTAPAPDEARDVRFTFTGDSDGTLLDGAPFFNEFEVLDAARAEDADFFVYLGDQIYSDSFVRGLAGMGPAETLDEYRDTWLVNRTYPALRDLLAGRDRFLGRNRPRAGLGGITGEVERLEQIVESVV